MTQEKLKEYHDSIIMHLAKLENRNKSFVFDELYEDLPLPPDYRIGVWKKLSAEFKVPYIDVLRPLQNTQSPIIINQDGLEYAEKLDGDIYKKTGKSILHPPPLADSFEGEHNERNIILHAIKYLIKPDSYEIIDTMFPNIKDEGEVAYIDSILVTNDLFNHTKKQYYNYFELKPSTRKRVIEIGAERFVKNYFIELEKQAREKETETQTKWYLHQDAKQRFDDYPKVVKHKWIAIVISIAAIIVTIAIEVLRPKCN